ncbi:MAG: DUF721 domain-containing protein [Vicingaceae bacterium]
MSDSSEKPLKGAIDQLLRAYGLGEKLDEISLVKSWEETVGKMIAKHTTNIYFKSGTLYISLDSAPLRHELSLAKSKLIERLNQQAGKRLVVDIRLN